MFILVACGIILLALAVIIIHEAAADEMIKDERYDEENLVTQSREKNE